MAATECVTNEQPFLNNFHKYMHELTNHVYAHEHKGSMVSLEDVVKTLQLFRYQSVWSGATLNLIVGKLCATQPLHYNNLAVFTMDELFSVPSKDMLEKARGIRLQAKVHAEGVVEMEEPDLLIPEDSDYDTDS